LRLSRFVGRYVVQNVFGIYKGEPLLLRYDRQRCEYCQEYDFCDFFDYHDFYI